jgi:hypothetical protein
MSKCHHEFHRLVELGEKIMAQIDDLNTALSTLQDAVTAQIARVEKLIVAGSAPTDLTKQIAAVAAVTMQVNAERPDVVA